MSKLKEIFEYLRKCPGLSELWSIAATEDIGVRVVLPQGASPVMQYSENIDINGTYQCEMIPYPSVYEDYQINCFELFDSKDDNAPASNINVLSFDEVKSICDWIVEQNDNNNLPAITGEQVISVECNPFVPQIRYTDPENNIIAYFITVRIRYVNKAKRKSVEYEHQD